METTPISPQKKLYNYHRENGLCPKCGKLLDRKGFYCEECKEKHTAYQRETRELCRQLRICPECRKNKLAGEEKICPECLAKKAEYRANHPLNDDKRRKNNEAFKQYSKNLYAERRKAGICVRCGKAKAVKSKAKCFICQSKDNAIHRKRTENRQNIKEYRKENHLCYRCGEPIDRPQGQLCQKCWQTDYERGKSLKNDNSKHYWRYDNQFLRKK